MGPWVWQCFVTLRSVFSPFSPTMRSLRQIYEERGLKQNQHTFFFLFRFSVRVFFFWWFVRRKIKQQTQVHMYQTTFFMFTKRKNRVHQNKDCEFLPLWRKLFITQFSADIPSNYILFLKLFFCTTVNKPQYHRSLKGTSQNSPYFCFTQWRFSWPSQRPDKYSSHRNANRTSGRC